MFHYRKPGAVGGRIIRQAIGLLKQRKVKLPLNSHILLATSSGSDSLALAHMMVHYGRRIAPSNKITLLHINHGWRGSESDDDARFVRCCAENWNVPVIVRKLKRTRVPQGESWENVARSARKEIFDHEAEKLGGAVVLTAHQADDLAETLLWRIFTGSASSHGGGIAGRS